MWNWLKNKNPLANLGKGQLIVYPFVTALLIFAGLRSCSGAELAVELGSTYVRGETASAAIDVAWPGKGPGGSNYECSVVLNGPVSPSIAGNFGAECLIVPHYGRVYLGLGLAYLSHTDQYNSVNLNFALLARVRITSDISLVIDNHWSNAGTHYPNYGRDMARLRVVVAR